MKRKNVAAPPNVAAKALREGKFRQRVVKAKDSYSRKEKHKKRDVHHDDASLFLWPTFHA